MKPKFAAVAGAAADSVFESKGDAAGKDAQVEMEKLHAKIGELTMVNDFPLD